MQLRGGKWKYKYEKMISTVDTIKVSLLQFSFYELFLMLKENQETHT